MTNGVVRMEVVVGMAVSWATRTLLDRYVDDPSTVTCRWESTVVDVVLRHGSRSDVEALLPVFVDDPAARANLVPIFARYGDIGVAERLLDVGVEAGRLRDDVPTEVLRAVGYLGCESAERILWEHVEGASSYSYHTSMDACLGLLHLSCRGLRTEIAEALERHAGSHLFPEFLPVLAGKTGDPSWLGRLVEWGETRASTDCNGGLILGIALHGDAGRAEFARLLWNPHWEAYGGGTGSDRWAYAGARALGLGMPRLYADLIAALNSDTDPERQRHCIATFTALLRHWENREWLGLRMAPEPDESGDALCDLLFEWSSPHEDDSLIGLARRVLDGDDDGLVAELYHLEALLRRNARHEMELRAITSR
ncbi:hypothetical protein [Embleya hyalina]|uniref:Uncharacterized protein n=1 Tax=Embleya hyalina TaxID=516124 RepID=A0A401YQY2_9ACTN|nr:hypothetical protein [Embleya hyalina]GCD97002.1 hypothetical protein EHYA_04689 [Embleya hyalina]